MAPVPVMEYAKVLRASLPELRERAVAVASDADLIGLIDAGVLSRQTHLFAARYRAAQQAGPADSGLGDLLASGDEEIALISRVGREAFEEAFLTDAPLSLAERASRCGITVAEATRLSALVDSACIQADLEEGRPLPASGRGRSVVAAVSLRAGQVSFTLIGRDLWKARYKLDADRRDAYLASLSAQDAGRARSLLSKIQSLEKCKSTLYAVLELLVPAQEEFFRTGDPGQRKPLTQRSISTELAIAPSAVNQLIATKAIRCPDGVDVPLLFLFPTRKEILAHHVAAIASNAPTLTNRQIAVVLQQRFGAQVDRKLISKYRRAS